MVGMDGLILLVILAVGAVAVTWVRTGSDESRAVLPGGRPRWMTTLPAVASIKSTMRVGAPVHDEPVDVIGRGGLVQMNRVAQAIADASAHNVQYLEQTGARLTPAEQLAVLCGPAAARLIRVNLEPIVKEAQERARLAARDRQGRGKRQDPVVSVGRVVSDPDLDGLVCVVPLSEGSAREAELAAADAEVTREEQRRIDLAPRLVRVEGDGADQLPITPSGGTIGRAAYHGAGQLAVRMASRDHAAVGVDEQGPWYCDLGSKHGSTVNGVTVGQDRVQLRDGDTITIAGEAVYRVVVGSIAGYDTPDE
jgi:hypothetical protein